jgi:hypothetical protein
MKKLESHSMTPDHEPVSRPDTYTVSEGRLGASGIDALEELKQRLLQETAWARSTNLTCLRRAADDAASLAWTTAFPLLVLPELFSEKAAEASIRSQRQRDIRQRSLGLTSLDE